MTVGENAEEANDIVGLLLHFSSLTAAKYPLNTHLVSYCWVISALQSANVPYSVAMTTDMVSNRLMSPVLASQLAWCE
ncbi:hypothetical protein AB4356_07715 [Vibrio lentus]